MDDEQVPDVDPRAYAEGQLLQAAIRRDYVRVRVHWRLRLLMRWWRIRQALRSAWAARGRPTVYRELQSAATEHRGAIERALWFGGAEEPGESCHWRAP